MGLQRVGHDWATFTLKCLGQFVSCYSILFLCIILRPLSDWTELNLIVFLYVYWYAIHLSLEILPVIFILVFHQLEEHFTYHLKPSIRYSGKWHDNLDVSDSKSASKIVLYSAVWEGGRKGCYHIFIHMITAWNFFFYFTEALNNIISFVVINMFQESHDQALPL